MSGRTQWIESAAYDLPLISLAPLLGLLIAALAYAVGEKTLLAAFFVEANFFVLGMPHYLSTYVFYFDDENVRYHSTRKFAFYGGPLIVLAVLTAAMALHLFLVVAAAVAVWNVFHVSRQSSGILAVYRHRAGGNHPIEKLPATIGLLAANSAMFLINAAQQNLRGIPRLMGPLIQMGGFVLLIVAGVFLGLLVVRMGRRGAAMSEWIFLVSSVLLFAPYLFIRDLTLATTAMLSGHFVQYLGLVWLINHRKYAQRGASFRERALAAVSQNAATVLATVAVFAIVPLTLDRFVHAFHLMAFHAWWLNATVLLHFYLDGLFWAFRDPHVRRSLGPFLIPQRQSRVPFETNPIVAAS
ncbi:MAG TPA: hypothetical protein VER58_00830 [Thermoanaerobaculia bacterium]|nr:hypothetical protein [Thermoanaerobaculia bacterium]